MSNSLFGKGFTPIESNGASKKLPSGGYICRIMNAKMENAKSSGLPMVVAQFDIADGEYTNYYHNKYATDIKFRPNANYQGIIRVPAVDSEGNARKGFNSFCGAVEKSNDIKLPTEDMPFLNALKGAMVGIIFGREEVRFSDGSTAMVTKPKFYRSVETIQSGNYDVPSDVFLEPSAPSGSLATDVSNLFGGATVTEVDSFSSAEDDIPFK